MAVDAAALAAALGVTEAEGTRLLGIATPLVDKYLRGATDCPEAIRDEAILRVAGHAMNRASYGIGEGAKLKVGGVQLWDVRAAASAVRRSGAGALLAPWVKRTA